MNSGGFLSFTKCRNLVSATQIGWHFVYKAAGMQWQKASKTHTFLDLHPRCLKGRFEAKH